MRCALDRRLERWSAAARCAHTKPVYRRIVIRRNANHPAFSPYAGNSQKMENCICPGCVSACRNDPGRLVPDDVRKLSRLLGISERDLENDYLVIVSVASGGHTLLELEPEKRKS